jgi:hypothetical protein
VLPDYESSAAGGAMIVYESSALSGSESGGTSAVERRDIVERGDIAERGHIAERGGT